jgi:succinate-semialdehyde dehydrogenase/glutarate-semialdehyde dehydrogenase
MGRMTTQLFIGGAWSDALDGATFAADSPATGESLGLVAEGTREDAARAIDAAAAAFEAWAARSPFDRARLLHRVADVVVSRRDALARILTLDQGKPLQREAYYEVDDVVAHLRMAAEDAVRIEGSLPPSQDPRKRVLVTRRPLGVVGVITPWNWPFAMGVEMIAPALASGNTVVWTPAPSTAACSAALAAAFAEADLPSGVFNFVSGPGPVVGDEIAANPGTVMITFVGSTVTGAHVARRAAGKRQLLELGNNGPLVVMDSADLERAVTAALDACFLCAGQSCMAGERLLVHAPVHAEFVERLAAAIAAEVRLGDPLAPDTTMGPLNNAQVASKMDEHVEDALSRGAALLSGGTRAQGFATDLYWPPTLLDGVPAGALTLAEETFGPIAPVMAIASLEEAVALTNAGGYGLAAAIFTSDMGEALRYADRVRAGLVNVNETSNYFELHLPFGGGAGSRSGIGRTGGRHIMEQLTETQTVTLSP